MLHPDTEMLEHSVCLAAVSLLGVLEQAYFSLQVISARRKFSVAPPSTSGPAEFERVYRAQANCSEYFPLFITVLWLAGLFFSQGLSSFCGLLYLYGRYLYFRGYCQSSQSRYESVCLSVCVSACPSPSLSLSLSFFFSFSFFKYQQSLNLCITITWIIPLLVWEDGGANSRL
ncbi:leukotriene C4 synthase isoform X1 [Lampris incognitus]|uniref:leukotriene C4 synthase isoform X1 n=1 Tax=Lampris incognitus TaxID=2546036 RepID=UPI0024B600CC|nr:leukotriene C4 synthase isoform X1 [Lampris incognitus]